MKKLVLSAAVACLLTAGGAQASVVTFDSIGDAGTLLFSDTRQGATLSASITFTLTTLNTTSAVFAVSIANNSSGAGQNRLTSIGIDVVSPALTGASEDSASWGVDTNTTMPGGFQQVDLCTFAGNSCQADAGAGLGEGGSASFNLTLTTAANFTTNGISFTSPYAVKFQSVGTGGQSWEFPGCLQGEPGCGGGGGGGGSVPEPAPIALMGLALAGMAAFKRRRARTQ